MSRTDQSGAAAAEGQNTDRYRDRARSMAGLCAAAAGALAIALYSGSTGGLSFFAVSCGVLAAALLGAATASFGLASLTAPDEPNPQRRRLPQPWIVRLPPAALSSAAAAAALVLARVIVLTRIAIWSAAAALLALLVAVTTTAFAAAAAPAMATATISFTGVPPAVSPCGRLAAVVHGTIPRSELSADGPILLRLDRRFCRQARRAVDISLHRADVQIAVAAP